MKTMNKGKNGIVWLLMLLACSTSYAQKNRTFILSNTNVETLQRMSQEFSEEFRVEHERALKLAKEKGWPTLNLMRVDQWGNPVYYTTTNNDAASMTGTISLRDNNTVYGSGMTIGEWDEGRALATHQDFGGRVIYKDAAAATSSHSTHVAGTLIGNPPSGVASRGMAPSATLHSYEWTNDYAEMTNAASQGLLVSNHSYGTISGWNYDGTYSCVFNTPLKYTWYGGSTQFNADGDDLNFGIYDLSASQLDGICRNAPFYLPVYAAGNDNTDNPEKGATALVCDDEVRNGTNGTYVKYNPNSHPAGDGSRRSNIPSRTNAKNILTVGNLQGDYSINESSSRGMTDDGRIKPDICGKGTDLYSADNGSNDDYSYKTGTSMAAPNVSGSLLLLQELYEKRNGSNGTYMRSATLKGLTIHTASDLGNSGPDVVYGWGLLNASLAGQVINDDVMSGASRIMEFAAPSGLTYAFYSDGSPIRVTLCYTDNTNGFATTHNDATPRLINDLDLVLTRHGYGSSYPYVLDVNNPTATATTGDNDRDNVEQIYIPAPPPGLFEVYVNVEGSLTGSQPFSLIVSGMQPCTSAYDLNHGNSNLASGTYVGNNITSSAIVPNGTNAVYVGVNISLRPGFSAVAGSNFSAKLRVCD